MESVRVNRDAGIAADVVLPQHHVIFQKVVRARGNSWTLKSQRFLHDLVQEVLVLARFLTDCLLE